MRSKHSSEISSLQKFQEDINKSDVFDMFWDLIEQYKQFVDTLDLEQLVALYNIIGYFMLLNCLFSICAFI
jgi:hypothetical protein